MAHSDKPNRTCFECRRKRLKCDNARPQCLRCRKARRLCPGYPSNPSQVQVDSIWSIRTLQGPLVVASNEQTTPSSRSSITERDSGQTTPATVAWLDDFFVLRPAPSPVMGDLVAPLFFKSCTTTPQNWVGLMSFVPEMYGSSEEGSCLRLAVDATAHANVAHQLGVIDNMSVARMKYLKASLAVREALSNDKVIEDSTIASLYMLNFFEFLSADPPTGSHIDGMEALLLLRARHFKRENNRMIYQCLIVLVLVKHLRDGVPPTPELVALVKANSSNDPRSLWASHLLEVMQLRQQLSRIIDDKDNVVELFLQFTLGTRLRQRFRRWPETDDETWSFTTVQKNLDHSDTSSHVYTDPSVAVDWNTHRRVQIELLMTLLQCGERLLATPYRNKVLEDMALFRFEIVALFDETIASFTYLLGGIEGRNRFGQSGVVMGAYSLLWSIGVMLRTDLATSKQKAASIAALEYMSFVLGLRRALELKKLWTTGST